MPGTELIATLFGSVALLLWGVRMVRTGMTRAFGGPLRHFLTTQVKSRTSAFFAGLGVTGLLQSSTATALLLASFTARGLLTLTTALIMMLGANVGTTIAAQAFSFEIIWLWTVLVGFGVFVFMAAEGDKTKAVSRIAIGLGLMLLSLQHLTAAAQPLRDSPLFVSVLAGLAGDPLFGFLIAVGATWLMHSSLTMVLLVMALATAGAVPMPLAFALILGANVGGAIAPLTGLATSPPAGRRVAIGNIIQRAAVAIPALLLVRFSADILAFLGGSPARMVVNFHTAFNIVAATILLPLTTPFARLTEWLVPDRPEATDVVRPRHLDASVLDTPSESLACAMRETLALGDRVSDMLRDTLPVLDRNDMKAVKEIEKSDNAVDAIYEAIKLYLVKASKAEMNDEESRRYVETLTFTTNLEHIGDIIDKNLMELAAKKIKNRYAFSPEGFAEIRRYHERVMDNMRLALNVFATRDVVLARRLLAEKATMRNAELEASELHFARLRQGRPESIETSSIHLDILRDLKRINGHLTSVAYPILEVAGELRDSRLRVTARSNNVAIDTADPSRAT
ncbi:Na+/Pi-cotransporter [Variibacter gotjawalensis]|uniref:Na+/Pi-cotransporter n=2 Tax=Variibacter gotjawalensis TaxID=1333996 RepID=A0A0S3PZC6_9BRAD|nr:phosphate:Na+ symporter [Variibacter gotjawalensis]BAT61295.1 Na+/Pi-cotransporter [Variibacter gotjawalensis]